MPTSIQRPEVQTVFEQARSPQTKRVTVGNKTVEIPTPFPSPEDWRDHWIYFLLVDRFNNPDAPPRFGPFDGQHGVFQGGTFDGVRQQLDYLKQLGVGAIWLSPVLKNCQYNSFTFHGYGIQDFLEIDPRFCSDPEAAKADPQIAEAELRALIEEAHARGIYVIFDIVLNHTGDVFESVFDDGHRDAEADFRNDPYTINWRDENGHGRSWSRILNDRELLIVANTNTGSGFQGEVIVDFALNPSGSNYEVQFTNLAFRGDGTRGGIVPGPVVTKAGGAVENHEVNGAVTRGPARALPVTLARMEIQILAKIGE